MFSLEAVGDKELLTRFEAMPAAIRQILSTKMRGSMDGLLAAVRGRLDSYAPATTENHGPTGKLADSLAIGVIETEDSITGRVWADPAEAPYAFVQEYGGGGGGPLQPQVAEAMHFIWHGKEHFRQFIIRGETPAKRYLRDTLASEGPAIVEDLHQAVMDGLVGN